MAARAECDVVVELIGGSDGIARRVVIGFSLTGVAAMALFGVALTYWWLLALTLIWGAAWPGILPIVDGQAMQASARGDLDYGRTSLWGSVTFIGATIGGGYLLQAPGSDAVHILLFWRRRSRRRQWRSCYRCRGCGATRRR